MEFKLKKRNKISKISLYDFCMRKIAKEFQIVEHEVARLPYSLINDLHNNRNKYNLDNNASESKIFIHPGVANLNICDFLHLNQNLIPSLSVCKNATSLYLIETKRMSIIEQTQLILYLPQLQKITLYRYLYCTDKLLSVIATNCPQLRYLDLRICYGVTNKGIKFLCSNTNMKINYLDISATCVEHSGCLRVLNTLTELKVFKHDYWTEVFEHLKLKIKSENFIKHYNVEKFERYGFFRNDFQVIINFFPKVRILELIEPPDFNSPNALSFCSNIQHIKWNGLFFQLDVKIFGQVFPLLKSLHVRAFGSQNLNYDEILKNTENHVPFRHLRKFYLEFVDRAEDISTVLENCYNLEELKINYCNVLTDNLFKDIIKLNPLNHLKKLQMYFCNLISTKSLLMLLETNNCLESVHIDNCPLVDLELLEDCVNVNNFNVIVYSE